jgi:hypothetical protein
LKKAKLYGPYVNKKKYMIMA